MYIDLHENKVIELRYDCFNRDSYEYLTRKRSQLGYISSGNSEIYDDEIISHFRSKKYLLTITNTVGSGNNNYQIVLKARYGLRDSDNGKSLLYYDNGNLWARGGRKNGKTHGFTEAFFENGQPMISKTFNEGKVEGLETIYYENGKVKSKIEYRNDIKHGSYQSFFENGEPKSTYTFLNGLRNGKGIEYDEEKGRAEINFIDDTLQGEFKYYDKSQLIKEGSFRDGKLNGEYIVYTRDDAGTAIVKQVMHYKDEILNGPYYTRLSVDNIKGYQLLDSMIYVDGLKDGFYFSSYDDTTFIKGQYKKDKKHGYFYYGSKQKFKETGDFESSLVKEGMFELDKKEGTWNYYNMNGKIDSSGVYFRDKKNGVWNYFEIYDNSKDYLISINYSDGIMDGPFQLKDENNKLELAGNYKMGVMDGDFLVRENQGNCQNCYSKGKFVDGKRNGEWNVFSTESCLNKDLVITLNYKNGNLDGNTTFWENTDNSRRTHTYKENEIKSITIYLDSNPIMVFDLITKNVKGGMKWKKIFYHEDNSKEETEYWIQEYNKNTGLSYPQYIEFALTLGEEEINQISPVEIKVYKQGIYKFYNAFKQVIVRGTYSMDKASGQWIVLWPEQKVRTRIIYNEGIKEQEIYYDLAERKYSGSFELIDKTDGTREVRKIKDGLIHGKTIIYSIHDGEVIESRKYKKGVLVN